MGVSGVWSLLVHAGYGGVCNNAVEIGGRA